MPTRVAPSELVEQAIDRFSRKSIGKKGGDCYLLERALISFTENNLAIVKGAIEFWLKPNWDGNDGGEQVFFEVGDEWFVRFRIIKDGAHDFRFMVWSSKTEYGIACSTNLWMANDWHQARATWQAGEITLVLDGAIRDSQNLGVLPEIISDRLFIGSAVQRILQAEAVVGEFIISNEP